MPPITLRPVIDDVTLEALERDPYPSYTRWRRENPVAYLPVLEGWVVSRWDDCEQIGKAEQLTDARNAYSESYFGPNLLNMDGDPHRLLRESVEVWLRPRAVKEYVERLTRPVVRGRLDRLFPRGRAELTGQLLERVSVRVVGDVLGLADVDDETLQRWFHDLSLGVSNFEQRPELTERSDRAKGEVGARFAEAVERLTGRPDGTGWSHLINPADAPPRGYDDLIGTVWMIMLGALQEPGHAVGATLYGLLMEGQYASVAADPSLIPAAIHEGIRWLAPFATVARRAVADVEVGGVVIPAGEEINLVIASANHDETRYEDPGRFDLHRPRLPVASFGYGAHFCAGHFLARELDRIVIEEVIARLPNLRLDPEQDAVVRGFFARGVKTFPVVWDVE